MNSLKERLGQQLDSIKNDGLWKEERVITSIQSSFISVNDKDKTVFNFCSNNYLGLSSHPDVIAGAARHGDSRFGLIICSFHMWNTRYT